MTKQYIKIKDEEIPVNIKNYKTSKSVKIYFKGNQLTITKPKRLSMASLKQILKGEENSIYEKYIKNSICNYWGINRCRICIWSRNIYFLLLKLFLFAL